MPPTYRAPLEDVALRARDLLDYDGDDRDAAGLRGRRLDDVMEVLARGGQFCSEVLPPLNGSATARAASFEDGAVRTPRDSSRRTRPSSRAAGPGSVADPAYGGAGPAARRAARPSARCCAGANLAFSTYPELTHGAALPLVRHGSDEQRGALPAQAGRRRVERDDVPDRGARRHRPRDHPHEGGARAATAPTASPATKIFISAGEHDLTENIVHLVLAKLPGRARRARGDLDVPRAEVPADRGRHAGTRTASRAARSSTRWASRPRRPACCNFDGATGWLVGEPHRGMRAMFTMMNGARLGVGMQGLGLARGRATRTRWPTRGSACRGARSPARARRDAGGRPDRRAPRRAPHAAAHEGVHRGRGARSALLGGAASRHRASGIPTPAQREEAADLVALMTPVIKAFLTDKGFESANLALQVLRRARLHPRVRHRAVRAATRASRRSTRARTACRRWTSSAASCPRATGACCGALCHPAAAWVEANRRHPELGELAEPLGAALGRLQRTTLLARRPRGRRPRGGRRGRDGVPAAAGPDDVRLPVGAHGGGGPGHGRGTPEPLRRSKVELARFYMARVLPETSALARQITAGKATVMRLEAELL